MDLSETIGVYDVKVNIWSKLNEYINIYEYQRSRSFIDLGPRLLIFNTFSLLFLGNHWGRLKSNFVWCLHGMRE